MRVCLGRDKPALSSSDWRLGLRELPLSARVQYASLLFLKRETILVRYTIPRLFAIAHSGQKSVESKLPEQKRPDDASTTRTCSPQRQFRRVGRGLVARNLYNLNTKVDWHQGPFGTFNDGFCIARLPPDCSSLEHSVCEFALSFPFRRIEEFLIAAKDNETYPFLRAHYFICFDANEWIRTHPLNLLPNC